MVNPEPLILQTYQSGKMPQGEMSPYFTPSLSCTHCYIWEIVKEEDIINPCDATFYLVITSGI